MKIRLTAAVLVSAAVILFTANTAQTQSNGQKPVRESTFRVEPGDRLDLDALWSKSDIVVEGIVQAARVAAPSGTNTRIAPLKTDYEFRLLEVYKTHTSLPGSAKTVVVRRFGGVVDKGDHVERHVQEGFPPFEVGERYVLFLMQNALKETSHYIMVTAEGDAALQVNGSALTSRGKGPGARSMVAMPYPALSALLRQRGGR